MFTTAMLLVIPLRSIVYKTGYFLSLDVKIWFDSEVTKIDA